MWPDPSAPGGTAGGGQGGVELKMTYWLLNNATENGTAVSTWDGAGAQAYVQYLNFAAMVLELGGLAVQFCVQLVVVGRGMQLGQEGKAGVAAQADSWPGLCCWLHHAGK